MAPNHDNNNQANNIGNDDIQSYSNNINNAKYENTNINPAFNANIDIDTKEIVEEFKKSILNNIN